LTFNKIVKTDMSNWTIKIILNLVAITGTMLTFLLIKGSMTELLIICYSVGLIVGSIFYRVRPREIKEQTMGG
jgi:hypothetical protein